jgi:hypothetical protein
MPKIFLVTSENDNVGNAVAAVVSELEGFHSVPSAANLSIELGVGDVLIVGDHDEHVVSENGTPNGAFVQFMGCQKSPTLIERLVSAGTTVAGISPVIAPRVANRVIGFGGPLRVKPDAQWGLVGFGENGVAVARKLEPTEASVTIAEIRTPRSGLLAELNVRRSSLDLMMAGSDAVSIHVSQGPTASQLISERELNLMKPGAVLVNTSHSSVVDEQAVIAALSNGSLAGYATDAMSGVITGADKALFESGKIFASANRLTNQVGAPQHIAKLVAANIKAFQEGSPVQGLIDFVDFPKIGDPSFWSSRMSPRQD